MQRSKEGVNNDDDDDDDDNDNDNSDDAQKKNGNDSGYRTTDMTGSTADSQYYYDDSSKRERARMRKQARATRTAEKTPKQSPSSALQEDKKGGKLKESNEDEKQEVMKYSESEAAARGAVKRGRHKRGAAQGGGVSQKGAEVANEGSNSERDSDEPSPGAVAIPGPNIENTEPRDFDQQEDGNYFHIGPSSKENETLLEVEAQIVPETQDIDLIVNRRVDEGIKERLREELGVAAEVVAVPDDEKKICNLPRYAFFGIIAVVVLLAVAAGISVGVLLSRSSSKISPAPAPTAWSRSSYIASTLEAELNGAQPWTTPGSPQFMAFNWMTRNDTSDIHNFTSRQILERYVLAVLYYNVQEPPPAASDALSYFLQPVSVCKWNKDVVSSSNLTGVAGTNNLTGVTACDNGTLVSELIVGTFARCPSVDFL